MSTSTVEDWEAFEERWQEDQDLARDLLRIRGYALACASDTVKARNLVTKAVDAAERARKKAELEIARCNRVCLLAERAAAFAARAMAGDVDADVRREVATRLEELFG